MALRDVLDRLPVALLAGLYLERSVERPRVLGSSGALLRRGGLQGRLECLQPAVQVVLLQKGTRGQQVVQVLLRRQGRQVLLV